MRIVLHGVSGTKGGLVRIVLGSDVDAASSKVTRHIRGEGFFGQDTLEDGAGKKVHIHSSFVGIGGGKSSPIEKRVHIPVGKASHHHIAVVHHGGSHHSFHRGSGRGRSHFRNEISPDGIRHRGDFLSFSEEAGFGRFFNFTRNDELLHLFDLSDGLNSFFVVGTPDDRDLWHNLWEKT